MAFSLTESAAERVHQYLEARGEGIGLRLGITATGCSGYSYLINFADEIKTDDVVFEDRGIKIIVDAEALKLIDGTEVPQSTLPSDRTASSMTSIRPLFSMGTGRLCISSEAVKSLRSEACRPS